MANTYVAIATVTVGSGGAATIQFSSIAATWTDLALQVSLRSTNASSTASEYYGIYFNGSTSNLTYRRLYADGTATGSDNGSIVLVGSLASAGWTSNTFTSGFIYIPNYAGSNNKSFSTDNASENNSSSVSALDLTANLWSNTAAITSITIAPRRDNFAQYSTATLYGIKNS